MSETQFRLLLQGNREGAARLLMTAKVEEWLNDGQEEVIRCLTCWAQGGINLGDDETLVELAHGTNLLE